MKMQQVKLKAMLAIMGLATVLYSGTGWSADRDASITGTVTDASGQPVSGAFVKLHDPSRSLVFMVISQTRGRYTASGLPAGDYTLQAVGGDYQSRMSDPVTISGGSATRNLALTEKRAPDLPNAWPGLPPGVEGGEGGMRPQPKLPAGQGKQILEARCTVCHDVGQAVTARSKDEWPATLSDMREYMQGSTVAEDLTATEEQTLLSYLTANFVNDNAGGGGKKKVDPNSRLPRSLMRGQEARYMAVEYTLPVPHSGPHELTLGPKGDAWVTERADHGMLGHFSLRTLKYSRIAPPPGPSENRHLNAIVNGPGNKVWFVDGHANRRWYSFDTRTLSYTTYPLPPLERGYSSGNTMRVHPDGSVWLNAIANNQVMRLEPTTGEFTVYNVPSGVKAGTTAGPYGMGIDGYGNIWFVENRFNKVGRLDPTTGKIDEYDIPVKDSTPRKMGMDADGNIWVGLHGAGKLMKIDYRTLKMKVYSPPTKNAGVYSIWADYKNNYIWFSEQEADKIGRFDPETETFVEFPLASAESDHRRIQVDQDNPNRIWWSGNVSNKIGYIEVYDWNP